MNRLIFVCMGNICRSPLAEAVARAQLVQHGLDSVFTVVSRGTHAYHLDLPADPRAQALAEQHGLALAAHRSRLLQPDDFQRGDLLLVMDRQNLRDVRAKAPPHAVGRIRLLMDFVSSPGADIPDPYYGEAADFERALGLIEQGVLGLTKHLLRLHNAGALHLE